MTEAIELNGEKVKVGKNNAHNYFGVTVLKGNHKEIKRIKRESDHHTHHGNKVWKSSLMIMDYLETFPIKKKLRVMEVGCGWGITGIYCAKRFKAKVTGVDIDPYVFPFLNLHAEINGVKLDTKNLDFNRITSKILEDYDLIIGGDICFWDEMAKPLFNLVKRAHKAGVRSIIADPGREPYNNMAEKCVDKFGALMDHWSVPHPHNASGTILDVPGV